jgi:hypothetical protein
MAAIRLDPLLGARRHGNYAPHRRPPAYAGQSESDRGSYTEAAESTTRGERKRG